MTGPAAAQAAERRATICRDVYAAEIEVTGTVDAWTEFQRLLASVPRPGASGDEEWAYCGPELLEPDE